MITVRVSDFGDMPPIVRQTPGSNGLWKGIQFHVNEDIEEADYWIVLHSSARKEKCICPPENVILLTQEPGDVKKYPENYLKQFSRVMSCQTELIEHGAIKSFPANPWFVGANMVSRNPWRWKVVKDYDALSRNEDTEREDKIVVITSNKRMTAGHIKRLNFIENLKDCLPGKVDIYGTGFRNIEDKYEVLSKYKYALIIENSVCSDYWTEKLSDCYLSQCLPFYYGCPNILDYFNPQSISIIDINNPTDSIERIKTAIKSNIYTDCRPAILQAKDQILNKYNIFNVIYEYIIRQSDVDSGSRSMVTINSLLRYEMPVLQYSKYQAIKLVKRILNIQ